MSKNELIGWCYVTHSSNRWKQEILFITRQVVRKETERLKNEIYNDAREIAQNASARATVLDAEANAQALGVVEEARSEGLKNMYTVLGITSDEEKAAFNYLRSLRQNKNIKLNVGYKSLAQFQN